jgi:putative peptidoglycan lipid II flippase
MPEGIVDTLFRRGEFSYESMRTTSSILFFYSFGLFFFCAIKLLVTSFYSLKDTITPAKTATFSLLVNGISSAILMFPLKIGGVALGTTLAAIFNFILLYYFLVKKIGKINWGDTRSQLIKVILLSLTLGIISRFMWFNLFYNKYIKILIIAFMYSSIFLGLGFILGFKQIHYLKRWIFKRK